jgi:hypothetical protein
VPTCLVLPVDRCREACLSACVKGQNGSCMRGPGTTTGQERADFFSPEKKKRKIT